MDIEKGVSKNIDLIGYHDLNDKPGFQMALQTVEKRWYLYVAHWLHQGLTILEVTKPSKPRFVKYVAEPGGKPGTCCFKVQVADGIMVTNLQQKIPIYHGNSPGDPFDEGINIWDVKDPENPALLSHWKTGAIGTHRNYYGGGRYVHLSAACPGFTGNIYRIVDIVDPRNPVEVGRWWLPEQWAAGGVKINREGSFGVHGPPYPAGNSVYLSFGGIGMIIVDISDISQPKYLGKLQTTPPFGWIAPTCHTVLPIATRKMAIMTSEGRRIPAMGQGSKQTGKTPPANFIGVVDVSNEKEPVLMSVFPTPEPPPNSPFKNYSVTEKVGAFGFGPHNLHEPHYHPDLENRDDRIYVAYCSAGVRIYDISDHFLPREIAFYVPRDPSKWAWQKPNGGFGGDLRTNVEDILVDKRGYMYVTDMQQGLHILRCTI